MGNGNVLLEGSNKDKTIDFVVRFEPDLGEYVADVFLAHIEDTDEAYIDSFTYNSVEAAAADLKLFSIV